MTKSQGIRVRRGTRQKWVAEHAGRYVCQCGCGTLIKVLPAHFHTGVPQFVLGHAFRVLPHPNAKPPKPQQPCECGCRVLAAPGMRFRTGHNGRGKTRSEATKAKISAANSGENNWNWGGRSTTYKGRIRRGNYMAVWVTGHPFSTDNQRTGGYVREHRLVLEQHLRATEPDSEYLVTVDGERYLRPDIEVHHINGIKDDNRIENLEPMTKGEHTTHHRPALGRRLTETCRNGHPLEGNRYVNSNGESVCRTCRQEKNARNNASKRAKRANKKS